ncbi:MAG TPA: hypothetical protein ACFCUY_06295 [Xenococcaceae cyanobacterium]|jgi:hypothetical protein
MNLSNQEPNRPLSQATKFIEEIGITLAAQDLTPTMVSQDFLKFSGIIPKEWELSQQPVLNPSVAQLSFQNGISINAQPRTVTFNETISNKKADQIKIPQITAKYAEKLPHAEYVGLSFNPKILVPCPSNPQAARKYITGKLLGSGSWKQIGKAPMQAGLNLMYLLDRCQLNLSIAEAKVQQSQQPAMFAVLFSGGFNYNLSNVNASETMLDKLMQALNFWQTDLKTFREIVTDKFLGTSQLADVSQEESVFPTGTI